jgi:hypothetical protein
VASPYKAGSLVTWVDEAPKEWRYTITPGPMTIISARQNDVEPTELAKKFDGGFNFRPGWIVLVEYEADSTQYYNPPRSILLGKKRIQTELHEMWLKFID